MKNTIKTNTPDSIKDYWQTTDFAYRDACHLCGVDGFDVDVAANHNNSKCSSSILEDENALLVDKWHTEFGEAAWCNPPFSRKVEFIQKAYEQRRVGLICMMLPYEPTTAWRRKNVSGKATVVYVPDGRYNFIHPETGLEIKGVNFASAFVVFTSLFMPTQYVEFKRGVGTHG